MEKANTKKFFMNRCCQFLPHSLGALKTFWYFAIFWFPYCVLHYPTRLGGGADNQIKQFMGADTLARQLSPVLYEGHYITNHHPVLLTLYYGFFFKLGDFVGHVNIMVFIMSCITFFIYTVCITYMMCKVKAYLTQKVYDVLFFFMLLNPIYGMYSYVAAKDNLFSAVMAVLVTLFFIISVNENAASDGNVKIVLTVSCMILPFLKNQGIYIVVPTLVGLGIVNFKFRKIAIKTCIGTILLYVVIFSHVLMPMFKIAAGGKQEALSVPFQQTALFFKEYKNEVTQEEYDKVAKVLSADKIADLYTESRADAVKFTYNSTATDSEMMDYFNVWLKQFLRHPHVYFKAWYGLNSSYYMPGRGVEASNSDLYSGEGLEYGAGVPNCLKTVDVIGRELWIRINKVPIIKHAIRTYTYSWILFIAIVIVIVKRKRNLLLPVLPLFLNFAVLLLCPWNGILRYELPLIIAVPIDIAIICKGLTVADSRLNNCAEMQDEIINK